MAKDLLVSVAAATIVVDAKRTLTADQTWVTDLFAAKTRPALAGKFYPAIVKATEKQKSAAKYHRVASKGSGLGLIKPEAANTQRYVTRKTLDGLFYVIGEEERKIRHDPPLARAVPCWRESLAR